MGHIIGHEARECDSVYLVLWSDKLVIRKRLFAHIFAGAVVVGSKEKKQDWARIFAFGFIRHKSTIRRTLRAWPRLQWSTQICFGFIWHCCKQYCAIDKVFLCTTHTHSYITQPMSNQCVR
eukprot:67871_1